jgi:hypothetical protein
MRTRAQRGLQRHSALRGVNPWLLTSQVDVRHCVRLPAAVGRSPSRGVLPDGRSGLRPRVNTPLTRDDRWFARSAGRGGTVPSDPAAAAATNPREQRVTPERGPRRARRRGERSPPPSYGDRAHTDRGRDAPGLSRERRPEFVRCQRDPRPGVVTITGARGPADGPAPSESAAPDGLPRWRPVAHQISRSAAARAAAGCGPESVTVSGGRRPGKRSHRRSRRLPRAPRRRSPSAVSGVRARGCRPRPGPSSSAGHP